MYARANVSTFGEEDNKQFMHYDNTIRVSNAVFSGVAIVAFPVGNIFEYTDNSNFVFFFLNFSFNIIA